MKKSVNRFKLQNIIALAVAFVLFIGNTSIVRAEAASVPTSLSVQYEFVTGGNYDESSSAAQVLFYVTVKDQFGNIVPKTKVYYKNDESEVSYTQSRTSDSEGIATFKYSYVLEDGASRGDYKALFSLSKDFSNAASQEIHIVKQYKKDLVLYEDQIFGTLPGENKGKIIDVTDGYEIWTGEVHQGAYVVGSGTWEKIENGEVTGLSAGQHILRAGERIDYDTNTFYLHSDYADFFVPRGVWEVNVDTEASSHVIFTQGEEYAAESGGTVYLYVEPEEGYEITSYEIDKPSRVSTEVTYYEEQGYIALKGVTGDIVITVTAE